MLARAFICLLVMLLNQTMMDAFGKIAGAKIVSGHIDLYAPLSGTIYAVGELEGQTWDITAEWINGYPRIIVFTNPSKNL